MPAVRYDPDPMDGGGSPTPNERLNPNAPPAFVSKTYEVVEDTWTDGIVSWGPEGNSFVVWDQAEFSKILLPKHFKHSNFSSFVRQLNTYGFKKVSLDRIEFANEKFLRGQKHLLNHIYRKRPSKTSQSEIVQVPPITNEGEFGVEKEIKSLKKDRSLLMQEVIQLRQQQTISKNQLGNLGKHLQVMEQRQQKLMLFLAKAIRNPSPLAELVRQKGSSSILTGVNKRRRLPGLDTRVSSDDLIVKYQSAMSETMPKFGLSAKPDSECSFDSLLFEHFSLSAPQNLGISSLAPMSSIVSAPSRIQSKECAADIPTTHECELTELKAMVPEVNNTSLDQIPTVMNSFGSNVGDEGKLADLETYLEELITVSPEPGENGDVHVDSSIVEGLEAIQEPVSDSKWDFVQNLGDLTAHLGLLTSEITG